MAVGLHGGLFENPKIIAGETVQLHYYPNYIVAMDTSGSEFVYNTYTNNLMNIESIRVKFAYATDDDVTFIGFSEAECDNAYRYADPVGMIVQHIRNGAVINRQVRWGICPRTGNICSIDISDFKRGDTLEFRLHMPSGGAWSWVNYVGLYCNSN